MKHRRAELNETSIVQRPGWPPLIKHEEFTGTLVKLSKKISSVRQNENEAREFVTKNTKLIELTFEWCELADDEDEIARRREQLEIKIEEVICASDGETRLRKHREMLEAIEEQAEKKLALELKPTNAAAEERHNDAKAEVLSTSAVLQMVMDLVNEPDQERRRAKDAAP